MLGSDGHWQKNFEKRMRDGRLVMEDLHAPFDDDETNVEGYAAGIAIHMPLDDPEACREICKFLPALVESMLTNRAARHRQEDGQA